MGEFGADVCRWWLATISYEGDIKSDHDFFRTAGEAYRKVRNTLRFMLSNLDDFTPSPPGEDCGSGEGMCVAVRDYPANSIDAWVLGEFDKMNSAARAAYGAYNFRGATERIYNFCNDTLSAVYLAAVKDRPVLRQGGFGTEAADTEHAVGSDRRACAAARAGAAAYCGRGDAGAAGGRGGVACTR